MNAGTMTLATEDGSLCLTFSMEGAVHEGDVVSDIKGNRYKVARKMEKQDSILGLPGRTRLILIPEGDGDG